MKKCPQCQQPYDDQMNFCLTDGATLVAADSFPTQSETPTVFNPSAAPPIYIPTPPPPPPPAAAPPTFNNPSFNNPSFGTSPAAAAPPAKSKALLVGALAALVVLAAGAAVGGIVLFNLGKNDRPTAPTAAAANTDTANKTNAATPPKSEDEKLAANLRQQQEKLEKEKQKLEKERKELEAKKREAAEREAENTDDETTTATVIDPPTNVRATPNGRVICVVRQRGATINTYGSTGVSDDNGTWYYTDACGDAIGVIHSSQIRF